MGIWKRGAMIYSRPGAITPGSSQYIRDSIPRMKCPMLRGLLPRVEKHRPSTETHRRGRRIRASIVAASRNLVT